jgi:hypothetical protein
MRFCVLIIEASPTIAPSGGGVLHVTTTRSIDVITDARARKGRGFVSEVDASSRHCDTHEQLSAESQAAPANVATHQ